MSAPTSDLRLLAADRILHELVTDSQDPDLAAALVAVRRAQLTAGWARAGRAPRRLLDAEMRQEVRA